MHEEESLLLEEDELDSRSQGVDDLISDQENGVVKLDIGSFVLCHRKLCHLLEPFVKCYKNFLFVTRWQSQRLSLVVLLTSLYLSINNPVYLLVIPLVYCTLLLSFAAIRTIGSNSSKSSIDLIRKKFKRKKGDCVNLELKLAAIKQSQEDLRAYINISIQIQALEDNLCEFLEEFYRICRWEETSLSKAFLLLLLSAIFLLVLISGKYLITVGILGTFLGNADFKKVLRQVLAQFQRWLKKWKQNLCSPKAWSALKNTLRRSSTKLNIVGVDSTETEYEDQWYDAETSLSESDISGDEDDVEDDEDEDACSGKRHGRLFSGLSMVSHFSDYRKKKKRISSGNCAACDVSFSSVLKKRQYCRHCGDSFCSRCCCKRVKRAVFGATAPAAYEETVLVCMSCYGYLVNKADDMKTDIW
ncbi:protrudin-like isoform X2 [Montipora foliosa]|uniref:protrudin-like isoform X2 n=1 Tax=Montipora foliosa TaxID=591990 RepID=UPI0035F168DB